MSGDASIELLAGMLKAALYVAGPLLAISLFAGLLVGIVQAATQVNEASISFVVKALAVGVVLVFLGPTLASHLVAYARHSLESVATVVRQ